MAFDLSSFVPSIVNGTEIQNAGSAIYVAPLAAAQTGVTGPTEYTITAGAGAVAQDAVTMLITPSGGTIGVDTPLVLRAGSKLHFTGSKVITVAQTLVITATTADQTLAIEPPGASNTLSGGETATTWGLVQILSPTDIPLNITTAQVDRKDLTFGLQGSEVKVGTMLDVTVATIAQPQDRAYWGIVYPAIGSSNRVYAHIYRSGGLHALGAAHVTDLQNAGNINEISRPTFTLKFQAPYAQPAPYSYLSTALKAKLNEACQLSGLAVYS